MKTLGWVFIIVVMFMCQVLTLCLLLDRKSREDRLSEIEEQTAMMNNQAAAHNLESEKLRRQYYETLVNAGIFDQSFLDYKLPGEK